MNQMWDTILIKILATFTEEIKILNDVERDESLLLEMKTFLEDTGRIQTVETEIKKCVTWIEKKSSARIENDNKKAPDNILDSSQTLFAMNTPIIIEILKPNTHDISSEFCEELKKIEKYLPANRFKSNFKLLIKNITLVLTILPSYYIYQYIKKSEIKAELPELTFFIKFISKYIKIENYIERLDLNDKNIIAKNYSTLDIEERLIDKNYKEAINAANNYFPSSRVETAFWNGLKIYCEIQILLEESTNSDSDYDYDSLNNKIRIKCIDCADTFEKVYDEKYGNKLADKVSSPNKPADNVSSPNKPADKVSSPNKPADKVSSPNKPADKVSSPNKPADKMFGLKIKLVVLIKYVNNENETDYSIDETKELCDFRNWFAHGSGYFYKFEDFRVFAYNYYRIFLFLYFKNEKKDDFFKLGDNPPVLT